MRYRGVRCAIILWCAASQAPREISFPIERNLLCQRPKVGSFFFVVWGKILANDNLRKESHYNTSAVYVI